MSCINFIKSLDCLTNHRVFNLRCTKPLTSRYLCLPLYEVSDFVLSIFSGLRPGTKTLSYHFLMEVI